MKWRSLEESTQETQPRSLREIFAERKDLIAKYVPADVQAIHARVVEELKESGVAERSLQVGHQPRPLNFPITTGNPSAHLNCSSMGRSSSASFAGVGAHSVSDKWKP